MPTYSYACTECDNQFDAVQAFSDDALTECPKCDGRLRKLFGKVGVVFKGSGFYRTDSRESAKSSSNGSSKSVRVLVVVEHLGEEVRLRQVGQLQLEFDLGQLEFSTAGRRSLQLTREVIHSPA